MTMPAMMVARGRCMVRAHYCTRRAMFAWSVQASDVAHAWWTVDDGMALTFAAALRAAYEAADSASEISATPLDCVDMSGLMDDIRRFITTTA